MTRWGCGGKRGPFGRALGLVVKHPIDWAARQAIAGLLPIAAESPAIDECSRSPMRGIEAMARGQHA